MCLSLGAHEKRRGGCSPVSQASIERSTESRGGSGLRDYGLFAPLPAHLLAVAYVRWVIDANLMENLALILAFVAVPILAVLALRGTRMERKAVFSGLQSDDPGENQKAFELLLAWPHSVQQQTFLAGLLPIVIAPIALVVLGDSGWPRFSWLVSIVLVSLVCAALSGWVALYSTRRTLARARTDLAGRSADLELRGAASYRRSWAAALQFAVVFPAVAGLLIVVDAVSHVARQQAESEALVWASTASALIADGDRSQSIAQRVALQLPPPAFWPTPIRAYELPEKGQRGEADGRLSEVVTDAVETALEGPSSYGTVQPSGSSQIAAFRRLADEAVVVVTIDRRELNDLSSPLAGGVVLVVLGACVLTIGFARMISGELTGGLAALQRQASRLESGDLRERDWLLEIDEMGAISRSLMRAEDTIRVTVEHASETVDFVEQSVASLNGALGGIIGASAEQSDQVAGANRLIATILDQLNSASHWAADLTVSIDESSSAVLELSAAGDELNETSSVLAERVDAVSNSLEQMVSSVKQVSSTTDRLAEASEQTSSSMEEMASAMRVVNISAETTANLSRAVVDKAELGQAKVVQTIEGMEAIREATDVAEHVILGLGARTKEIGGILDVIEDVADETNLLALNAAIIAAQAGEQGKAFSVVADEIKELADRVLASTKEIGGLIRAVQEESENAIGAIEAGSASVMSGVDLSAEAGRTLEEITEASRESGTRIGEIVSSVREQTKAAGHVVMLMERVRDSADQIGRASADQERENEVVYRSAHTIREVVERVRQTTHEQTVGFRQIRESEIVVRGAVERITGSLSEQLNVCSQVSGVLDRVAAGSRSNEEAAESVREAIRALASRASELREDASRFRI